MVLQLGKSLSQFSQSLAMRVFCNVKLDGYSQTHLKQVRRSPSDYPKR